MFHIKQVSRKARGLFGHLVSGYMMLVLMALVYAAEGVMCLFMIILSPLLLVGNMILIGLGRRGLFQRGEMSRFEVVIALDGFQKKLAS